MVKSQAQPSVGWMRHLQATLAPLWKIVTQHPLAPLCWIAALIEGFLLGLCAVAPIGGVSQTISPLARQWPWLLAPARLLFGNALVDGSVPPARGWPALALFAMLLLGASAAATVAIVLAHRLSAISTSTQRHLALVLGGAAVFGLTMLLLPALPSDDVFSYILYGRISAIHQANPLIVTPAAFPHDSFLHLVFWQGTRSVYGPAWLLLSAGLTLLAQAFGGSLASYVLLFKLLGFAAHLANALLIWLILGRLAPQRQLAGALLYAWNPLCLLEFCASAHNDAVMLTFALLGLYCLVRGWEVPALVSFGLSISVKYVLLALLPLYLALVIRQRLAQGNPWQQVALAALWRGAVVLGVVVLTALPYWAGAQTFGAILYSPPAQQLDNSLLEAISWPLRSLVQALGLAQTTAASVVENGLKLLGLLGFLALGCYQLWRVRDLETMLRGWAWVLLGYALIASGWYWPWYATWAVALVALSFSPLPHMGRTDTEQELLVPGDPFPRREGGGGLGQEAMSAAKGLGVRAQADLTIATLLLAGGSLTLYAFLPLYSAPIYGYRAFLALGPAAGYLLLRGWQTRQRWQHQWRDWLATIKGIRSKGASAS